MLRFLCVLAAIVATFLVAPVVSAQTAFVEGHVFNKRTGLPLPGATVRVTETVTVGPIPNELGAGTTDENGFYQFEIEDFLGFPANIDVECVKAKRVVLGRSTAVLRDGVIRRDIYLQTRRRTTRCLSIETR